MKQFELEGRNTCRDSWERAWQYSRSTTLESPVDDVSQATGEDGLLLLGILQNHSILADNLARAHCLYFPPSSKALIMYIRLK